MTVEPMDERVNTRAGSRGGTEEWMLLNKAVARLRASILAVVFGLTSGTGLFVGTAWLLIQGGNVVGPHLALLANYLPGYTVSWSGALLGFFEAGALGAGAGFLIGLLYNFLLDARTR